MTPEQPRQSRDDSCRVAGADESSCAMETAEYF